MLKQEQRSMSKRAIPRKYIPSHSKAMAPFVQREALTVPLKYGTFALETASQRSKEASAMFFVSIGRRTGIDCIFISQFAALSLHLGVEITPFEFGICGGGAALQPFQGTKIKLQVSNTRFFPYF